MSGIKGKITILDNPPIDFASKHDNSAKIICKEGRIEFFSTSQATNLFQEKGSVFALFGSVYNIKNTEKTLINKKVIQRPENEEEFEFSPVEIIGHAYQTWGEDYVRYLNGDFILVVWNRKIQEVKIFRDHLGMKPLYYQIHGNTLSFSTRLKELPDFSPSSEWNLNAIQQFFRMGYVAAPHTIYKNVSQLSPGEYLLFNGNGIQTLFHWTIESAVKGKVLTDERIAKKELKNILQLSVTSRLSLSKNPGVFLSGGIDSSLIASVAQKESSVPISTFSVGFQDNPNDESKWSRKIAEKLNTNHHEVMLSDEEMQNQIEHLFDWFDMPFADSSALPSFLISQFAKNKIDVAFIGDGGDEQFMGYGMYNWAKRLHAFSAGKKLIKWGLKKSPKQNHQRVSRFFDWQKTDSLYAHIFSVEQGFFTQQEVADYFSFSPIKEAFDLQETNRKLSPSEMQSYSDLKYYVPHDLIPKMRNVANGNGFSTVSPLLDKRMVEWSINLDENLKQKNGISKYLLKQVLYDYLPFELFDRPKWGFGIPMEKWLGKELKPLLNRYVNREELSKYPFYKVDEIMKIKTAYLSGKTYLYNQLWLVIVFNMWAEQEKGK